MSDQTMWPKLELCGPVPEAWMWSPPQASTFQHPTPQNTFWSAHPHPVPLTLSHPETPLWQLNLAGEEWCACILCWHCSIDTSCLRRTLQQQHCLSHALDMCMSALGRRKLLASAQGNTWIALLENAERTSLEPNKCKGKFRTLKGTGTCSVFLESKSLRSGSLGRSVWR